jgi:transcriptional regulator with XRE-family HTH domain
MSRFGEKMARLRKEKKIQQGELAEQLNKTYSVVSKYERGEVIPSIEVAKDIARLLDVSLPYLLDDSGDLDILSDTETFRRLKEINKLNDDDRTHIYMTIDALLRDSKTRQAYK